MENKNISNSTLVSFTKIIAYFSLFYSVVLFLMICINFYYYNLSNDAAIAQSYLFKNKPYAFLLLGVVTVSAINFYTIKKQKYNWIIVGISIFLIGFARIKFEQVYQFFN